MLQRKSRVPDPLNLGLPSNAQVQDIKHKHLNEGSANPVWSVFKSPLGSASNQMDEKYQDEYECGSSMSTERSLNNFDGKWQNYIWLTLGRLID